MLGLCVQVIFNLVFVALFVIAGKYAKKQVESLWTEFAIICAYLDKSGRDFEKFKADFDIKFGKDLAEKIETILRIGEKPSNLVAGKDGHLHKVNRAY